MNGIGEDGWESIRFLVLASSLAFPHPKRHGIPTAWRLGPQGFRSQFWRGHVRRRQRILQGLGRDGCGRSLTASIDICLEAGVNLFDTANGYSDGRSEEILGRALGNKRDRVLISTKAYFPTGDGPNDRGTSRYHLRRALEDSLRRLEHRLHRHLPHARLRRAHARSRKCRTR